MTSFLTSLDGAEVIAFEALLTIGRHPFNDLRVDHRQVSGHHAVIEWTGQRWRLRDLGSSNGTSVNKRRLKGPKNLREGDVIRFAGTSAWRVQALAEPLDALPCGSTVNARSNQGAGELHLHLAFVSADEGTIRAERLGDVWEVTTGQRFVLLYSLARKAGGWVADDDLKVALWGRSGIYDKDPSALHKLIYDTRRLFEEHGIGGWVLEKQQGRTRLALPVECVHVQIPGEAG